MRNLKKRESNVSPLLLDVTRTSYVIGAILAVSGDYTRRLDDSRGLSGSVCLHSRLCHFCLVQQRAPPKGTLSVYSFELVVVSENIGVLTIWQWFKMTDM
jgi:hypothetical protein